MAMTLRNTDILFNDGTAQATALSTTSVLNATAGASAGAVGTYAFATRISGTTNVAFGDTLAGSSLGPISAARYILTGNGAQFTAGSALSGTWRAMGTYTHFGTGLGCCGMTIIGATLWLRIS